jgi:hypothetical protein
MRCLVCGSDDLRQAEYKTGSVRAPAFECGRCHAIQLDEVAASSEEDRESVRLAVAARQAAVSPFESATMRTARHLTIEEVDAVCSEASLVLAEARVCLDSLAQSPSADPGSAKAVADASDAIRRLDTLVEDLARRCDKAAKADRARGGQTKLG